MATRYWVGGTGTWDSSDTTHWSATSGGAGGETVPTTSDDVFFDVNSGTGIVTKSGVSHCQNFDCNGYTGTLNGSGQLTTGSGCTVFRLGSGMSWGMSGAITIGSTGSCSLTLNGKSLSGSLTINGGVVTLQDTLVTSSSVTLNSGTFDSNDQAVTASSFIEGGYGTSKTLDLGNSTWILTKSSDSAWFIDPTSTALTLIYGGSAVIKITGNSAFRGGGLTYPTVWFDRGSSTSDIRIYDSNTFAVFKDTGTAAHSIRFTAGTTQTITTFTVSGTSGNLISIDSDTTGTHALVKAGGGVVSSDYLDIQHSVATPASTWYAGANSTNDQGVSTAGSGWIFTVAPSVSPSVSPSSSPSLSASASISPSKSPSLSPSASPSVSPSSSISPSSSPTGSRSPSVSPSTSISPSISPSVSPSTSISPSISPSVSPSLSPSISPSLSPSVSPSLSPSPSAGIPVGNPSIITVASRVQQALAFPQFVIGGLGGAAADDYALFKQGTTYGAHIWRSEVFRIGRDFDILELKFPVIPGIGADMDVLPVIYFDNETGVAVGTRLNPTNYPDGDTFIKMTGKNFENSLHGKSNFFLEFRWLGTELITIGLPIVFHIEVQDEA